MVLSLASSTATNFNPNCHSNNSSLGTNSILSRLDQSNLDSSSIGLTSSSFGLIGSNFDHSQSNFATSYHKADCNSSNETNCNPNPKRCASLLLLLARASL